MINNNNSPQQLSAMEEEVLATLPAPQQQRYRELLSFFTVNPVDDILNSFRDCTSRSKTASASSHSQQPMALPLPPTTKATTSHRSSTPWAELDLVTSTPPIFVSSNHILGKQHQPKQEQQQQQEHQQPRRSGRLRDKQNSTTLPPTT